MKFNKHIWRIKELMIFFSICFILLILFSFYIEDFIDPTLDILKQEVMSKSENIDGFLSKAGSDILYLSELSNLHDLINSNENNSKEKAKLYLQDDFLEFSKEKGIYYQIRYIDENGQEIVRIDSHESGPHIIPEDELQNKKGRYYIDDTIKQEKRVVFTSPLDLNIEQGKIENRGTKENPVYISVIRYGTPVFNEIGKSKGIVITNIYADYFLKEIQKNHTNGDIFLINAKGFYLSHSNPEKEFEFIFNKKSSFYKDYKNISKTLLENKGREFLKTDGLIVSFRYIYPAYFQGVSKENHFWVLAIVLDEKQVFDKEGER